MDFKDETLVVEVALDSKCHPDLGDGRTSWEKNLYKDFMRCDKRYVVVGRQTVGADGLPTANHVVVSLAELVKWQKVYGIDNVIEYKSLPVEEGEI